VDPRAGLDDIEKRKFLILPGLEPPCRITPGERDPGIHWIGEEADWIPELV
jgi:hypothetical protein